MNQISNYSFPVRGEVLKKYAPKYEADTFFCQLWTDDWQTIKAMVHESHYAKFDVGDVIGVDAYIKGSWLKVRETTELGVVKRATPEVKDLRVAFGYVSDPKLIGEDFWYLAKVGNNWFRIPYSVASKYWLGDQSSEYSAFQGSYYELLGVDAKATSQEIHRAWRGIALKYHPDLFPPEQREYQTQIMMRVNAAHDCLMDDDERVRYDAQLAQPQAVEQKVKAWPGRGFGILRCLAEVRGDSFLVTKIMSWANREFNLVGNVVMGDLRWTSKGLMLDVKFSTVIGSYQATEPLLIAWEHLPTRDWASYDVPGHVRYRIQAIRTGYWDWENKQVVRGLRVREAEFEWPEGFLQRRIA